MSVKISELPADATVGGAEMIPVSDAGTAKRTSPAALAAYTIDLIEAVTAGTAVTGSDSVFILQGGALKPVDIDVVTQYGTDTMWGKAAITTLDNADVMMVKDGGTVEKTVTLANVAAYVLTTIQSGLLNVSTLADGSGTLATTDHLLVTQGTTPKRITVANLNAMIYSALAAYVTALTAVTTPADADVLYVLQGGAPKKMTLAQVIAHSGSPVNGSGTAAYLAQWSDSDTLAAGPSIVTTFAAGDNISLPTTKAVRDELTEAVAAEKVLLNAQTGTTYTLALTDQGKYVKLTNASPITATVPPNSTVAFPIGTVIRLVQGGAGQVTVAEGAGVTINTDIGDTKKTYDKTYSVATLMKTAADTWDLFGDLEAQI